MYYMFILYTLRNTASLNVAKETLQNIYDCRFDDFEKQVFDPVVTYNSGKKVHSKTLLYTRNLVLQEIDINALMREKYSSSIIIALFKNTVDSRSEKMLK